jgi:putrescine aminotransferase
MKLSGSPVEVHGDGVTIVDHTGRRYLDFAGGYGVFTLGHRHPRVVAAVKAQLDELALSGRTMFNLLQGRLAKRLAELTPGDLQISFFANSGTEAVEAALKLARAATGRPRFVATVDAYHGKTLGALSVSGSRPYREPFGPLLADVVHVPFGDLAALEAAVDETVAAVIVEPIQAEGGVYVPPATYLPGIRAMCDRMGAVFVADEVQTGLGRCGARFACDLVGVVPDVMTLAKGLSGGVMPIGACIARADVWNAAYARRPLAHTSTFGGSELACAAALAALDVLIDDDLAACARERGAQLLAGAAAIAACHPGVIADVRGAGLLVGVELTDEGYAGAIIPEMLARGVTVAWTLNRQRVLRLEPALIVTAVQVDAALEALDASVAAAYERLGALACRS